MRKSNISAVREYLKERNAGATARVIAEDMGICVKSMSRTLKSMPDAYIARWVRSPDNNMWTAVWDVARVTNAPRP